MLEPGRQLLHYRIVDKLGEGGMGVVWRAIDTNLDRPVAIKVLPAAVAQDAERLARFEREAKLLASLNHPNIATVHGLHEAHMGTDLKSVPGHEGTDLKSVPIRFLAMELIEGEDLAARLARGPLPVEEALALGHQVAAALEAAHSRGVVHRDLKPANVVVTPEGRAKVLDFGLAKATDPSEAGAAGEGGPSLSPTMTTAGTQAGMLMGTAAYMSPEQARGKPVDRRADLWALGCLIHECLTGRQVFRGETISDSLAAVLRKDPDWSKLPQRTPPVVRLLLQRCLQRDPAKRQQDAGDARGLLELAIEDPQATALGLAPGDASGTPPTPAIPTWRAGLIGLAAGLALGAIVTGIVATSRTAPVEPANVRRFEFALDMKPRQVAISPDGRQVAFASEQAVYIRDLDALETRLLWEPEDKQGILGLLWSPDGASVAVHAGDVIWRVSAATGQASELFDKALHYLADWTSDGVIVHSWGDGTTARISARGGAVEAILPKPDGELHLHGVAALPGGRGMLIAPHPFDADGTTIVLVTPDGKRRTLHETKEGVGGPRYVSTGHIVYREDTRPPGVWALPFSLDGLKVTGEPFLIHSGRGEVSFSRSGDMVYTKGSVVNQGAAELVWVTRDGEVRSKVGTTLYGGRRPTLSRDGTRAAVPAIGLDERDSETDADLWIVDLERGLATRLAAEKGFQGGPAWSPDDQRIVYGDMESFDKMSIVVRASDGSGSRETLFEDTLMVTLDDTWSEAVVTTGKLSGDMWLEVRSLDGASPPREFQNSDMDDFQAELRPGGGLIAYRSGKMMANQSVLFLRPYPSGAGRWQLSQKEVGEVRWNRAGDRLYFEEVEQPNRTLMEVTVDIDGGRVRLGDAVPLFSMSDNRFAGFDVAPDGDGFLMLQKAPEPEGGADDEGIVVVENWFEEFR